ncbi:MAG: hypothetical protein ACRDCW_05790 [Sarcina sp.]
MKYTRYDVSSKKKNDDWKTTLIMIVAVVVLALLIGSLIFFKFLSPSNEKAKPGTEQKQTETKKPNSNKPNEDADAPPIVSGEQKEEKNTNQQEIATSTTEATTYTVVQCGYFSTKESAESVKTKIGEKARVLTEGDKFRVVCYIGNEEEAKKLSDKFTVEEIENTKARFNLPGDTVTDKSIIEMINGTLDIINKLNEAEVASVKSDEFKAWANELVEKQEDTKYATFSKLKKMINELPKEITKNSTAEIYQTIYDVLSVYK